MKFIVKFFTAKKAGDLGLEISEKCFSISFVRQNLCERGLSYGSGFCKNNLLI